MTDFFEGDPCSNPVGNGRGLSPEQSAQFAAIAAGLEDDTISPGSFSVREHIRNIREGYGEVEFDTYGMPILPSGWIGQTPGDDMQREVEGQ